MTDTKGPASAFREIRATPGGEPVAQGDIIRRRVEKCDPWSRLGIVVTADCDIAFQKHAGVLSYVPVVPTDTYLEAYWMPKRLQRLADAVGSQLHTSITHYQQLNLPQFAYPVSQQRAILWAVESDAHSVIDVLHVRDESDQLSLTRLIETLQRVTHARSQSFDEQCEAEILACMTLRRQKSAKAACDSIQKDRHAFVRSLPGDCLFLNEVGTPSQYGHICYLRLLREVSQDDIATTAHRTHQHRPFERIARLNSPFVYRLTQLLGAVFSSIGMPDEYERARDDRLSSLPPRVDFDQER